MGQSFGFDRDMTGATTGVALLRIVGITHGDALESEYKLIEGRTHLFIIHSLSFSHTLF
jgi:hypothetical protein